MKYMCWIAAAGTMIGAVGLHAVDEVRTLVLPVQHRVKSADGSERLVQEEWKVPLRKVALITMHLWNFAEIGGPGVPPENEHKICVADGTLRNALRARRIDWVYIRPTLTAARRAGMTVIHAQPGFVATKY